MAITSAHAQPGAFVRLRHTVLTDTAHAGLSLCVQSWSECDNPRFQAQWDALAEEAREPNPFYEYWYLMPSLRALDARANVLLLQMHCDGQLVGLMPIIRQTSYYGYPIPHWRNWVHDNCFNGQPLVTAGYEKRFWQAVMSWADRNAGTALFLHLLQLPCDGDLHDALRLICDQAARPATTVFTEERAMLASNRTPQAYYEQSISAKKRKELRRQHRRLAELGDLQIRRVTGSAGLGSWIDHFLSLEAQGWKGRAGSALASNPANERLFREAVSGAGDLDRLDRVTVTLDGKPIAMLASFLTPPGAFSYKTVFDERYARFSPGVLLQRENLEILKNSRIAWVDSCAMQNHKMIDHFWRERRRMSRHSVAIGGFARRQVFRLLARHETGRLTNGIAA